MGILIAFVCYHKENCSLLNWLSIAVWQLTPKPYWLKTTRFSFCRSGSGHGLAESPAWGPLRKQQLRCWLGLGLLYVLDRRYLYFHAHVIVAEFTSSMVVGLRVSVPSWLGWGWLPVPYRGRPLHASVLQQSQEEESFTPGIVKGYHAFTWPGESLPAGQKS